MHFIQSVFGLLRFNRKNWRAVTLCVFAATVFWVFNALNKNYTTNINLPLQFDYDEEKYIAVRPLPQAIRFNVTGLGWNLFRRSAGLRVPPLVVPLPQPSEVKKIVGSTVPALVTNQPEGFDINYVLTDTLHVAIEPKATRWIGVSVDIPNILFRNGFGPVSDIEIMPDSVFIEGPEKLINNLPEQLYLKIPYRNIDDDFSEDIEVKFLNNELIKRNPPTVSVSFDVDQYVEIEDSVRLQIANPPKGSWPVIGGKKLALTIAVPEDAQGSFSMDSLRAIVDLKDFKRGEQKLMPRIVGLPRYSYVVDVDSVLIKF